MPLFLESLLEVSLNRDGKIIDYEEVVAQLTDETVCTSTSIGLSTYGSMFTCSRYATTATVFMQVEAAKYETGLRWMRELLYKTVFTAERLKVIATKMLNSVARYKRQGRRVVAYLMKGIRFSEGKPKCF